MLTWLRRENSSCCCWHHLARRWNISIDWSFLLLYLDTRPIIIIDILLLQLKKLYCRMNPRTLRNFPRLMFSFCRRLCSILILLDRLFIDISLLALAFTSSFSAVLRLFSFGCKNVASLRVMVIANFSFKSIFSLWFEQTWSHLGWFLRRTRI